MKPDLRRAVLLGLVAGLVCVAQGTASSSSSRPLRTGVTDPRLFLSSDAAIAFRRVHATGSTTARLVVNWGSVAPAGDRQPAGFDASDPTDPHYDWTAVDREVTSSVDAGLEPILNISDAPRWAQPRDSPVAYEPDPAAFAEFAHAAATRYSGQTMGLPRVRYWEAWNEPNITTYLLPQWLNGHPFSPTWYRAMLNAFAQAVHGAAAGNVVIAGSVAPFADAGVANVTVDWGPLAFMRDLFCLSRDLKPVCAARVSFDVWSFHPYTSGGPTHHAYRSNDVSLGDLPKLRRTLAAAIRAGHVDAPRGVGLWATEFAWDSAPPDPQAVPMRTLEQWIPEALYQLWKNGVTQVTWFRLRDDPMSRSYIQSGLYFNGGSLAADRAKPILANFRFPLVVTRSSTGFSFWGRTPWGVPGRVRIQTTTPQGWRTIGTLVADRYGIFRGGLHSKLLGKDVRALSERQVSGRVRVAQFADHFYNPFGATTHLEPGG